MSKALHEVLHKCLGAEFRTEVVSVFVGRQPHCSTQNSEQRAQPNTPQHSSVAQGERPRLCQAAVPNSTHLGGAGPRLTEAINPHTDETEGLIACESEKATETSCQH